MATDLQPRSPNPVMECGQSVCGIVFSDRLLLLVNENDGNSTWNVLGSEPIRIVVVIRSNLIGHYLAGSLF